MSYGYPASNSDSSPSAPGSGDSSTAPALASMAIPTILLAHVVCGALATLLLLPLGVLIPRYGRAFSRGRWWFPLHMAAQLIGVILAITALATGYNMGAAPGTAHPGLAVALIAGLGAQVILGSIAHWYNGKGNKPVNSSGRGTFHFAHIGLGLAVILIGWATALTGFLQQWSGVYGAGMGQFIMGWKVIFGVFIGVFGIAYIVGLFALPSASRRRDDHGAESPPVDLAEKQTTHRRT